MVPPNHSYAQSISALPATTQRSATPPLTTPPTLKERLSVDAAVEVSEAGTVLLAEEASTLVAVAVFLKEETSVSATVAVLPTEEGVAVTVKRGT